MEIKYLFGSALMIILIGVMALPAVNGEVKTNVVEVNAGATHYFSIQAGEGNIEIYWEITDWNDDIVAFLISAESEGDIALALDVDSYSDTLYVQAGYFRVEWRNYNEFEGFTLSYSIVYQSYSEEVGEEVEEEEDGGICCGSVLAISIISMIGITFIISYTIKRK